MELLHELAVWLPEATRPHGGIYFEALTRTLEAIGTATGRTGTLLLRDRWEQSVTRLYWNYFIPVALGEVEVDEDLLETLPEDAVNFLTIHQAKGLEYPVVFVDVGLDFTSDRWAQAYARFPEAQRLFDPYTLEEELRTYSQLGAPRRSSLDRAMDDLVRKFYVAFSRAQHVLVITGIGDATIGPIASVPNIGTGWTRTRNNLWSSFSTNLI